MIDRDALLKRCKELKSMGSFAEAIAEAAIVADPSNLKILMDAFPKLLNTEYPRFASEEWWLNAKLYGNHELECGK
jgi:hypothetical protein